MRSDRIPRDFKSPNRGEILYPGSQRSAGPGFGIALESSQSPNSAIGADSKQRGGSATRRDKSAGPSHRRSDVHVKRISPLQASFGIRGGLKPRPALRSDPGYRIPPALGLRRPRLPLHRNRSAAVQGTVSNRKWQAQLCPQTLCASCRIYQPVSN